MCILESLERGLLFLAGDCFSQGDFFKLNQLVQVTRCLFKDLFGNLQSATWEVQFTGQITLCAQSHCPWKKKGFAILQVTREPGAWSRFMCPPYFEFLNKMDEAN